MKLNSIIFHTGRLLEVREFYEQKLNLVVGTYVKDNVTLSDSSDTIKIKDPEGRSLIIEGIEESR